MDEMNEQPATRISAARKKMIALYADAAGCLYGALNISEFVDVFNYYENEKTNEQETVSALLSYEEENPDTVEYSIFEGFITGPTLDPGYFEDDIERLDALLTEQEGKPRYLPERKDFLKFAKPTHYEPKKPYADLKAYIIENGLCDNEGIESIDYDMFTILDMIQDRAEYTELFEYFTERGYNFTGIDQVNAFTQVLLNACNNTRLYENNGHTPNEIRIMLETQQKKQKEPAIYIPEKVGRNDPCPCGSGKKFKKCCYLTELSGAAQLSYDECELFYETWYKLLDYVNKKHKVVKYEFSLKYGDLHDETKLLKIRDRLWKKPGIIREFVEDANYLTYEEISLLKSWEKHHIKGRFVVVKYSPWHAVLMRFDEGKDAKLYAVMGMTTSIAEAMHRSLPVMLETVLLPFRDKIVYDSFLNSFPIEYKSGATRMFDEQYATSEKRYGVISSLHGLSVE